MKIEFISQTVLKRSILKPLHTTRKEVLFSPSIEEMCTAMEIKSQSRMLLTTTTVSGNAKNIGIYAIVKAVNDLATRGASAIGIDVQILLPPHAYESRLKAMVEHMEEMCGKLKIQITCVGADVSPAVCQAVVTIAAVGETQGQQLWRPVDAKENQDIVMTGYLGLEGMLRVAEEQEEELKQRFVPAFVGQIMNCREELLALDAIEAAKEYGVSAMQQIGSGGILAALWETAEAAGTGLEVSVPDMLLKQETIEVCEYYHMNPYQLTSTGAVLMMTDDGHGLVQMLEKRGIRAARLGRTTAKRERVLLGGTEVRYLDRPGQDELTKWWNEKDRIVVKVREDIRNEN